VRYRPHQFRYLDRVNDIRLAGVLADLANSFVSCLGKKEGTIDEFGRH
jgi:hypothetical protein